MRSALRALRPDEADVALRTRVHRFVFSQMSAATVRMPPDVRRSAVLRTARPFLVGSGEVAHLSQDAVALCYGEHARLDGTSMLLEGAYPDESQFQLPAQDERRRTELADLDYSANQCWFLLGELRAAQASRLGELAARALERSA